MNAPCPPFPPYPPFPANPNVGDRFGSWVWNGSNWVVSPVQGITVNIQKFTASGTYLPSPGLTTAVVDCIGGGGGGGGAGEPNANQIFSGSGGGSGGRSIKTVPAALVMGGVAVTIGVGGSPGGNAGQAGNGAATSFGAFCVANGGIGGWAMFPNVTSPVPGLGAPPGIGDVTFPGEGGDPGSWHVFPAAQSNETIGAPMGGALVGGNQSQLCPATVGLFGIDGKPNTGAGGGGGVTNQTTTATSVAGGAGGSGVCIVTEYCSLPTSSGADCGCAPVPITDNSW